MRKRRMIVEGARYHVVSRANRREMIFESSKIKNMFMEVIRKAKLRYQFSIYNFCVMGNHFHFIIQPHKGQNLSSIMQWILSVFAKRFNRFNDITGHVWYDRFRSKVIQSLNQYLATFIYIAWNPVRAGITSNPLEYISRAPVAQLDRASDYGSEGWGFESLQACQLCNLDKVYTVCPSGETCQRRMFPGFEKTD